jgi:hypothetical protein
MAIFATVYHAGVTATMWTKEINFVSGLQLLEDNTVQMSYGAFDVDARMLTMKLKDLESHFADRFDCSKARVLKVGSESSRMSKAAAAGSENSTGDKTLQ